MGDSKCTLPGLAEPRPTLPLGAGGLKCSRLRAATLNSHPIDRADHVFAHMPKRSLKPSALPSASQSGPTPRVAVVVSRYNWSVTGKLLEGSREAFAKATGSPLPDADVFFAPGAFEVVALSHAAAESRAFDGVVSLGCIIKGETNHDEVLGHAVTQALANISLVTGVPVTLGVLTVNTAAQAKARSGGKHGNKGAEAMSALLATLAEIKRIDSRRSIGGSGAASRTFEIDLGALAAAPDKLAKGAH